MENFDQRLNEILAKSEAGVDTQQEFDVLLTDLRLSLKNKLFLLHNDYRQKMPCKNTPKIDSN